MPAARFWRAVGLQAVGGGALELSALHLYFGGVRVDAAATLTSTIAPASGSLAALQDEDTATTARWLDVSAPGFALVWDFGVGEAQDVAAVRLGSGALHAQWLETLTLQYSADAVVWQVLGTVAAFEWPGANALQGVPDEGDPYFSKVSVLLHCSGAHGSTTFTDSSLTPKTVTAYGVAKISTAYSEFPGGALELSGIDSGLYFGNILSEGTPYCMEAFVRLNASDAGGQYHHPIFSQSGTGGETDQFFGCIFENRPNPLKLFFYRGANVVGGWKEAYSSVPMARETRLHVALSFDGSKIRGFLEGQLQFEVSDTQGWVNTGTPLRVGQNIVSNYAQYRAGFQGCMAGVRLTVGNPRYTSNFAVPPFPLPGSGWGGMGQRVRGAAQVQAVIISGGAAGDAVPAILGDRVTLDREDFGHYRIPGPCLVEEKASPANRPLRRRVQLYNQASGRLIRETWSDAATGEYSFDSIRGGDGTTYFVVAFDHTGHHRAVIADNLVPELMQEAP